MAAPAHARTSSVHSLQLDEEEQLQIALALSSEDAALAKGSAAAAEHDERLARELQAGCHPAPRCLALAAEQAGAALCTAPGAVLRVLLMS